MVNRMASLAWKGERIDRAQMAQLNIAKKITLNHIARA